MTLKSNLALPKAWEDFIGTVRPDPNRICHNIAAILPEETIPSQNLLLRAFEETDPSTVKVLILGQDPYPTPGHACGLAFGVNPGSSPLPRSLQNIYKEIVSGCGTSSPCDIMSWPQQGVLLLNRWLSLTRDNNIKAQWDALTSLTIFSLIQNAPQPLVVMGWGKPAIVHILDNSPIIVPERCRGPRLFLRSSHPSPLSANRRTPYMTSFMGSGQFRAANSWIESQGQVPIRW